MFEGPIQRLIDELSRLPGVGRKSAQRLAFHLLNGEEADARRLAQAVIDVKEQIGLCARCYNVTAGDECNICRDVRRLPDIVCVVERAQDIPVIESTREFAGRYHVLGGALSPIDGIGPGQLRFNELKRRVENEGITELICATNPTIEGDATSMYIAREFKPLGVKVSRLASGLPVGGDLDYADTVTLGRALTGRSEL
ncbi:MAG: recombination protein RecR [Acidimicrobiia bacterium]|nr:recombination protein RecR [Acidimicrobiia bacterium]